LTHRFTQIAAQHPFIAELSPKTGNSKFRDILNIEVESINIGLVIVWSLVPGRNLRSSRSEKMKLIIVPAPVELRDKFDFPVCFSFYRKNNP
jgi:hypothetical protein